MPAGSAAATRLERLARLHLWAMGGALLLVLIAAWRVPGLALGPLLVTIGILTVFNLGLLVFVRQRGGLELPDHTNRMATHAQVALDIVGLDRAPLLFGRRRESVLPLLRLPGHPGGGVAGSPRGLWLFGALHRALHRYAHRRSNDGAAASSPRRIAPAGAPRQHDAAHRAIVFAAGDLPVGLLPSPR